jgi:CRISPR-associated protein Cas1
MDLYLLQNGTIERKDNTIVFHNEAVKRVIPIKELDSIYAIGEVNCNSKLFTILSQNGIPVHFFNYYGFYTGSFCPKQQNVSGKLLVEQVKNYLEDKSRLEIAKEILMGAFHNIRKTLMQYELQEEVIVLDKKLEGLEFIKSIGNLLLFEAEIRQFYYKQFNKIIKDKNFEFIKRVRQPPDNYINTLISFGNSLLYNSMLAEIFKTQLDPKISYLHEPFERRYSLNLDLSEIFKPLIVDRVIFTLINREMIKPQHFNQELNFCYLNDEGRKIFLKEFDAKMNSTLKYPKLDRNVSYRYMLRLECYKLIKQFIEGKKYNSFKIYW